MLRVSSGFQTLEKNKNTESACGLVVSSVTRVWKPDETLALVFEILLKMYVQQFTKCRTLEMKQPVMATTGFLGLAGVVISGTAKFCSKLETAFNFEQNSKLLRWPNTVFARALTDAIQHVHKDCKNKHAVDTAITFLCSMPTLSLLFFFVIERSVLMA